MIIEELEKKGKGFQNPLFNIKALYYADDGLLLSQSIGDAQENIDIIREASMAYGLEINKARSNIIIINVRETPAERGGIKVTNTIKYLGIKIDNKTNDFKTHKAEMIKTAQRLANLTFSIIEKNCNKLLIGKAYWKNMALPTILYVMGEFLFTARNMEENKETIYKVWKARTKRLREQDLL